MLSIPLDTLGWIIVKAREFDVKSDDTADGDEDADDASVLQDRADDPTESELTSWIEDLTDTQQAELVALFWLGRGDTDTDDFAELVQQAREARVGKTSSYLLGAPLLADYLEEGLEAIGMDVSEVEAAAR
jgi:hypothetical protein